MKQALRSARLPGALGLLLSASLSSAATDVALVCDLIETPTGVSDSWRLTVWNERISFFDNDSDVQGKRVKIVETGGGGVYWRYVSSDRNDPWTINLEDPTELGKRRKTVYAELFLKGKKRPSIFECKPADLEDDVKPIFEN